MFYSVIFATLAISSLAHYGAALTCFVCNFGDAGCADPINSALIKTIVCENGIYPNGRILSQASKPLEYQLEHNLNASLSDEDVKVWYYDCLEIQLISSNSQYSGTERSCVRKKNPSLDYCNVYKPPASAVVDFCGSCTSSRCNPAPPCTTADCNPLTCYYCMPDDPGCADPINPATISTIICEEAYYPYGNMFSEVSETVEKILKLEHNLNTSLSDRNVKAYYYECLEVELTSSDTHYIGTLRTCVRKTNPSTDTCKYYQPPASAVVEVCGTCTTSRCNPAPPCTTADCNPLTCYYCMPDDPGCADPINPATISTLICEEAYYPYGNMFSEVSETVEKMLELEHNLNTSLSDANVKAYYYECVEVKLITLNIHYIGTLRTCVRKTNPSSDACQIYQPPIVAEIKYCGSCTTNLCDPPPPPCITDDCLPLTCYKCMPDNPGCVDPMNPSMISTEICEEATYPYGTIFSKVSESYENVLNLENNLSTSLADKNVKVWYYQCLEVHLTSPDSRYSGTLRTCGRNPLPLIDTCNIYVPPTSTVVDYCGSCDTRLCNPVPECSTEDCKPLTCYSCNTDNHTACGDPADTDILPQQVCEKAVYPNGSVFSEMGDNFQEVPSHDTPWIYECLKLSGTTSNGTFSGTMRGCARKNTEAIDICNNLEAENQINFCETCDSQLCNSSSKLISPVILGIVGLVAFFLCVLSD